MKNKKTRRTFLNATAASATVLACPAVLTARRTEPNRADEMVIGEGEHQYRVNHQWAQLPDKYSWRTTHGVAVDSKNRVYVIHEGRPDQKDHPSIFVFDEKGKFIRAFGCQFQGGGHGIEVRQEKGQEFLYVCAYKRVKAFAKLTLNGDTVWYRRAPVESKAYRPNEQWTTETNWGRKSFLPTNFAFLDDGGFLLVDGYGSYLIHQYDKDAKWVKSFGGIGDGEGKFNLPHGIWVDRREGREPSLVVTDRAHNTLQILSMEGKHIETISGFGLPANVDTYKNLLLVPELKAQVSLLNEKNETVAKLGSGLEQLNAVEGLRGKPGQWTTGQFVHPHDACFDRDGNILVAEWVSTGRITKLTKV